MDLLEITAISNGDIDQLIAWLRAQNLLANPLRCGGCNDDMRVVRRRDNHVDQRQW